MFFPFVFVFFNALKWFCCAPQTVNHRNALERFPNDHVAQGSSRKCSDKIYGAMFGRERQSPRLKYQRSVILHPR